MRKFDLEDRMVDYSVMIIDIAKQLPNNAIGRILTEQIVRSGTSPALNYGEAQGAESRKDFIHKMKIALKELRETFACLKIIKKAKLYNTDSLLERALTESNELISIFVKSIETARNNLNRS